MRFWRRKKPEKVEKEEGKTYQEKIRAQIKKMPEYEIRTSWYSITKMINPIHTKAYDNLCNITDEEADNRTKSLREEKVGLDTGLKKSYEKIEELRNANSQLRATNQDYKSRLENIASQIPEDMTIKKISNDNLESELYKREEESIMQAEAEDGMEKMGFEKEQQDYQQ